jgi:hypothetical protein
MSETYEDTAAPADEAGPFDDVAEAAEALAEDAAELAEDVAELASDGPEPVESEEGTPADPDTKGEKRSRAAPTDLQGDMKRVTDQFVQGNAELLARLDGKPLTPSRVAAEVQLLRGSEKAPSTGAVAAAFKRWEDYGFATFGSKPYAFADYTDRGRSIGLKGILNERKASRVSSEPVEAPAEDG